MQLVPDDQDAKALEAIKLAHRNPRPLAPGDPMFFRASEPLWRDLDRVAGMQEAERADSIAVLKAQAAALEQPANRPADVRRAALSQVLSTLATDQAGVPLDPECGRIVAATFGDRPPRSRGRRKISERQRQRRRGK